MHDDVAGVEQHPVASLQALDAHATEAQVFQLASDLLGDRSDVPVGPAGGDHHEVTDGRLTCQIDRHDVLGLGVVEPTDDLLEQGSRLLSF